MAKKNPEKKKAPKVFETMEEASAHTDKVMDDIRYAVNFEGPEEQMKAYEKMVYYELDQYWFESLLTTTMPPLLLLYERNNFDYKVMPLLDRIFDTMRYCGKTDSTHSYFCTEYYLLGEFYQVRHNLNRAEECYLFSLKTFDPDKTDVKGEELFPREKIIVALYSINLAREKNLDALLYPLGLPLREADQKEKEAYLKKASQFHRVHGSFDPIETTSSYLLVMPGILEKMKKDGDLVNHGMGTAFHIWEVERKLLSKENVPWHSFGVMNPKIHVD